MLTTNLVRVASLILSLHLLSAATSNLCSAFATMSTSSINDHPDLQSLAESLNFLNSAKLIVFDKDGTLGDDQASLARWVHCMTRNLQQLNSDSLIKEFHLRVGWDGQRVLPSAPLAAGTWQQQVETVQDLLHQYCGDATLASEWHSQIPLHQSDPPLADLTSLFEDCQDRGLTIALCTSDERQSTDMALRHWKVEDMVSYSICGDEVSKPKPNPDPLLELCRQAQVKPGECIVVGDTISDTGMARQAKALLSVGVLTGSGTTNILTESGAHVVLQSVAQLPQLLTRLGRVRNDEN